VSLALVEGFKVQEKGQYVIDSVDVTCGLSLGEYTALTFVGAFRCVLLSFLP
jgi:[acyl-carrier-protein] S-malonyltransferase